MYTNEERIRHKLDVLFPDDGHAKPLPLETDSQLREVTYLVGEYWFALSSAMKRRLEAIEANCHRRQHPVYILRHVE